MWALPAHTQHRGQIWSQPLNLNRKQFVFVCPPGELGLVNWASLARGGGFGGGWWGDGRDRKDRWIKECFGQKTKMAPLHKLSCSQTNWQTDWLTKLHLPLFSVNWFKSTELFGLFQTFRAEFLPWGLWSLQREWTSVKKYWNELDRSDRKCWSMDRMR